MPLIKRPEKGGSVKRVCMVRNGYFPALPPNARNARALVSHGYKVDVICRRNQGEKSREIVNGATVYRFPPVHERDGIFRYSLEYFIFLLVATFQLTWLSLKHRYDVIEVSGMPDFQVFTAFVPKMMGTKVVLNLYDHVPEAFMEHFNVGPNHFAVRLLHWIEGLSVRWVDYCLATQAITGKKIASHRVPNSKISIILNVPDEDYSTHSTVHNVDRHHFTVMTHGTLLEIYGVQTLIKAVPYLGDQIPNLKVRILGRGEYEPQLKLLARSLGILDYIDFAGFIEPAEVPAHIKAADIGVVTIIASSNPMLPNKLFEYLDVGKPTVSASIPAITGYFSNNEVMFYQPDNEQDLARCILELYHNPEKRAALAAAGSAAFQKYRWPEMKREYLTVFSKLTGGD